MNRNYKVVWNRSLGCFTAVAEYAKSRGKSSSGAVSSSSSAESAVSKGAQLLRLSSLSVALAATGLALSPQVFAAYAAGTGATATGVNSTAVGDNANASNPRNIAIGANAISTGNNESIAIGGGSTAANATTASGDQSIAIGSNVVSRGSSSIAIGGDDLNQASRSNVDGTPPAAGAALNSGTINTAFRRYSDRDLVGTPQFPNTRARGEASVAIGVQSQADGALSTAFGTQTKATATASSAFGVSANASREGSVAIGAGSQTDGEATKVDNKTINNILFSGFKGNDSFAGTADDAGRQVSVGLIGNERQIKNLAPGAISASSTDAINGSQLFSVARTLSSVQEPAVVYTTSTGQRVYRQPDGTYNTMVDGLGGNTVNNSDIIASVKSAGDSTTTPTKLTNVANGTVATDSKDAVNGGQLKATNDKADKQGVDTAAALGGNATYNTTTGAISAPVYSVVSNPANAASNVTGVGGAINALNSAVQTPLTFVGDTGTSVDRKLGQTLNIKGGATNASNLTTGNIGVVANGTNTLDIRLNKTIDLGTDGSLKTGATTVNNSGMTIGTGANTVSLTSVGLNNGNNKITNVAVGAVAENSKDAVNGGQLFTTNANVTTAQNAANAAQASANTAQTTANTAQTIANRGFALKAADNNTVQKNLGEAVDVVGANSNITTKVANSKIAIELNPVLTGLTSVAAGSVTTGDSTLSTNGLNITGGPSVTKTGINANNTKITNVTDGSTAAGSKEAVNGGQLNTVSTAANRGINVTTARTGTGTVTGTSVAQVASGETATFTAGNNIAITQAGKEVQIAVSATPTFTSVTTGNTVTNTNSVTITDGATITRLTKAGTNVTDGTNTTNYGPNGFAITGGPSATQAGIDAGNKVITGVANGSIAAGSKEAVNGGQINTLVNNATTAINNNTTEINKGLSFAGDTGANVNRKLGQTLNIVGGETVATNLATGNNVGVVADGSDKLTVRLAKDLAGLDSVTTGNTVMNTNGVTITQPANSPVGITNVSLTNAGLNNGGNQITKVASGLGASTVANAAGDTLTNAANVSDLQTATTGLINQGFTISANTDGVLDTVKLGENVDFTNTDGNLVVNKAADNTINYNLADNIKANQVTIGNATNSTVLTSGANGLDVGGDKITSLAAGSVAATSTDAINGGQLNTAAGSIAANLGGGSTFDPATGTVTAPSYVLDDGTNTGTPAPAFNNVGAALGNLNTRTASNTTEINKGISFAGNTGAAINKKLGETLNIEGGLADDAAATGANLRVDSANGKLNLVMAKNLTDLTSVTTGNSTLNNTGLTIANGSNPVSLTNTGLNNGNNKITNVADGTISGTSTDAINGSQLNATNQNVTNLTNGTAGLVQQANNTAPITVGKDSDGSSVDFRNVAGTGRTLTGVSAGAINATSNDAINGSQLNSTNANVAGNTTALGGSYNPDTGVYTPPSYVLNNGNNDASTTSFNTVDGALTNLDTRTSGNTTEINKGLSFNLNGNTSNYQLGDVIRVDTDANIVTTAAGNGAKFSLADTITVGPATNGNPVVINGTAGTISGLTNKTFNPNNFTSGQAATEDQLKLVSNVANAGWDITVGQNGGITTNGGTANVGPGDRVAIDSGKNIAFVVDNTEGVPTLTVSTKDEVEFTQVTLGTGPNFTIITSTVNGLDVGGDKITNVAAGTISATSTDAINGSQLANTNQNVAGNTTALGGTYVAGVNGAAGTYTAPIYNVVANPSSTTTTPFTTVKGAVEQLSDAVQTPLTFTGNQGVGITRKLGETLNIEGALANTADASGANLRVDSVNGKLNFVLAKNLTDIDSLKIGSGANITTLTSTVNGLDVGNRKITNVANGTIGNNSKDAINGGQINGLVNTANNKINNVGSSTATNLGGGAAYNANTGSISAPTFNVRNATNTPQITVAAAIDALNQGFKLQSNNATNVTNIQPSETVDIGTVDNETNIKVAKTGNVIDFSLDRDLNIDSVKTGNTLINTDGLSFNNGTDPVGPSITAAGINAGSQQITGVLSGGATNDSANEFNAANIGDVNNAIDDVTMAGLNFVGDDSININRPLGSVLSITGGTTVAGDLTDNNIGVVSNGTTGLTVKLAKELTGLSSVTTGNTTVNNEGISITNQTIPANNIALTSTGLNNGNNTITNVASGGNTTTNAANVGDVNTIVAANRVKYFSVKSEGGTNEDNQGATGADAIAIGKNTRASGINSNAIGYNASANSLDSTAIGTSAKARAQSAIAIGLGAEARGRNALVLGTYAKADKLNAMAIGSNANANANNATAIGLDATASGISSNAIGYNANASGFNSTAIGTNANANANSSVALGSNSVAEAQAGASFLTNVAANANNGTVSVGSTTATRRITNVADGSVDTDGVNVAQLRAQNTLSNQQGINTAAALGGGATYNPTTGAITNPSYVLNNGDNTFNNVGSALGNLDTRTTNNSTEINKGINFGNGSSSNNFALGNTIAVTGDNNLSTVTTNQGIQVKLNKNINLGATGSVTTGNFFTGSTTVSPLGVTLLGPFGSSAANLNSNGLIIAGGPRFTSSGIDADDQQITGVASGLAGGTLANATGNTLTNAANIGDVQSAVTGVTNAGLNFRGDNGATITRKLGQRLDITGGATGALTVGNVGISNDNNNGLLVQLAENIDLGTNGSVKTGNTVINDDGITITGGSLGNGNPVRLTKNGLFNGGNTIKGVGNGRIDATSNQAINGSQLFGTANSINTILGGNATLNSDGTITTSDIGGTNKDNINDAIGAVNTAATKARTTVTGVGNVTVNKTNNNDGPDNYEVKIKDDLTLTSVTTGNTVMNNTGIAVNNGDGNSSTTTTAGTTVTNKAGNTSNYGAGGMVAGNSTDGKSTIVNQDGISFTDTDGNTTGPTITADGISAGNTVISGVRDGVLNSDAANVGQLNKIATTVNNGFNVTTAQTGTGTVSGTTVSKVAPGATQTITAGNNIAITQNGIDLTIATNPNLIADSVKTGNTTVSNEGLTILNGPSVTVGGINANNTKITNVTNGKVAAGSKDAVTGDQLFTTSNLIKNTIGGNALLNDSGIITVSNIGGTGSNTIDGAISAVNNAAIQAKSTVTAGKNVVVATATNANGSTNYQVTTADNIDVVSVKVGNTTINNEGLAIANGASITNNGINAGGKVVTGVADGIQVTDAANVGQLNALENRLIGTVNDLGYRIDDVADDANAGISAAMAMSSIPQSFIPGKSMVGGGISSYNGEGAVAVGLSKVSDNGRWVIKVNGTADTQGNAGGAVGAGFHF